MSRNQRGGLAIVLVAVIALIALSAGVYYYTISRVEAPSSSNTPSASVTKSDADASQVDASISGADATDLNDTEPTADDLGI